MTEENMTEEKMAKKIAKEVTKEVTKKVAKDVVTDFINEINKNGFKSPPDKIISMSKQYSKLYFELFNQSKNMAGYGDRVALSMFIVMNTLSFLASDYGNNNAVFIDYVNDQVNLRNKFINEHNYNKECDESCDSCDCEKE